MKKGLLLILMVVAVASCTTTSLSVWQYEQLSPASIALPNEIKRVAVIDRLNADVKLEQQGLSVNSKKFSEYLASHLADADYFDDIVLCDSDISFIDRNDTLISPLSQANVRQLTKDLGADMLVSVEHVSAKYINMVYLPIVSVKALARVYVPSRQGALRSLVVSDTLSWSMEAGDVTHEMIIHDVMAFGAEKLSHQLAPYWEQTERTYFTGGNANFRDADMFLKKGNWDMATQLWNESLASAKGQFRLQVLYNLVLAKEMQGDVDGAYQDCASLVEQCQGNETMLRLATQYKELLQKRSASQQMLNLQMLRFH